MSEGYRNIKEIARAIGDFADKVENGNLQKGDVEEVLQETRVLYERLVVLKFKLQEREIREVEENLEEPAVGDEVERGSDEGKAKSEKGNGKREMGKGSSEEMEEENIEEENEVPLSEREKEQSTARPGELLFSPETPSENDEDELKVGGEVEENTLASKFQNTPIQDIWNEIGINQQFLFTNELFQGNKEAFEESVEALNNLNDREEAIAFVENTLKPRFEWDPEDETVAQFLNLVERRYLT